MKTKKQEKTNFFNTDTHSHIEKLYENIIFYTFFFQIMNIK